MRRSAAGCSGTTNPRRSPAPTGSTWVVLAPTAEALGGLVTDERWSAEGLEPDPRVGVWTDDFHNLLSVLKWR